MTLLLEDTDVKGETGCPIYINPLPLLFKALLHGQKDHFFSGHLNLRTTETGLPSRKKNHNN